jgi:nitroreductase
MTNQKLFDAIFHRKSIRKYDMSPLPDSTFAQLKEFAGKVKPLDETIRYEFSYIDTDDVRNLFAIKAPHYICLYSEKKSGYLMNAGFLLQQIDLYLSANDLGSCWLGMAKPLKQLPDQKNGLEFVILLAFGNADEPLHRKEPTEFKRKNLTDISEVSGADELLEPVRLAPSAANTQPWFFSGNKEEITVSREKLNLIKAPLYGKMNQIDIGIALCHLWLSLDNNSKSIAFGFQKSSVPGGYEFMTQVKVGRKE